MCVPVCLCVCVPSSSSQRTVAWTSRKGSMLVRRRFCVYVRVCLRACVRAFVPSSSSWRTVAWTSRKGSMLVRMRVSGACVYVCLHVRACVSLPPPTIHKITHPPCNQQAHRSSDSWTDPSPVTAVLWGASQVEEQGVHPTPGLLRRRWCAMCGTGECCRWCWQRW
jgi:hypothetical protein